MKNALKKLCENDEWQLYHNNIQKLKTSIRYTELKKDSTQNKKKTICFLALVRSNLITILKNKIYFTLMK